MSGSTSLTTVRKNLVSTLMTKVSFVRKVGVLRKVLVTSIRKLISTMDLVSTFLVLVV